MGKMFNTLVLSGIIAISLLLIDGSGSLNVIAQFFVSPPTDWGSFLIDALKSTLGVASISGALVIGIGALIKQDWLLRLGMFSIFASWVNMPFIRLWQFLSAKIFTTSNCTNQYVCSTLIDGSTTTTLGMVVAGLLTGPLILYALWACWSQIWSPETSN